VIDMDALHATVQFPTILMIYAVGLLMCVRARHAWDGRHTVPSVAMLSLLAGYLIVFALGRTWWSSVWFLSALDFHDAATAMRHNLAVPIVLNVVSIAIGGAMIAVALAPHSGRRLAGPIVVCTIGVCVVAGALMAGML